ncbi:glycosyltransferase [Gloeocapsa sp. PCC 73106]|uniref:glycosyltransferase n=1 Tax=Gloeocapsa sp. PCC 73106 TaxID=102232 RepID=UPI0002AC9CB0|nr:cellulose synthase catalytic subunit [Gloeocapsa sp. PCC 73106]ELR97791.1 glycosyl transferase [Gloeocapsa sp. PCC 73106]
MKFQYFLKARPQTATLVLFGSILIFALIIILWLAGWESVELLFSYLENLQRNPPMWLETPMLVGQFLFFPTIGFFLIALGITKVSPKPTHWSRVTVVLILLLLVVRYLLWRTLSTLNLSDPLNGIFSLALYFFEVFVLFSSTIQLVLMLKVTNRYREADELSVAVTEGSFQPAVDIFIPTYNEPEFILRRTVIGCQALDYPFKTVYVLDDTKRPEMAQLSRELGCKYLTRPDNSHAKAGNLNHALGKTTGELIVVFDADFVPTRNFLKRTVGFFQDKQVALVQTPQSFYNIDPIARNLGLEEILTPEEEVFYRQLQPIKDAAGSVVCSGTSFVVRRKPLEEIGGFVTDSLSEDYFTGIRLSAQGHRLVYLDEKLSAGLAAENIAAHATQRLRWARGTLQGFFIRSNPLTIPGLSLIQRLAHLEGLLHWFTSFSTVFFLLMPLMYAMFGIVPIRATPGEIVYFFLPYYLTQVTVFSWLNHRSRSALLSVVYGLVLAFPLSITVIQVILNPFSRAFKVTPKGIQSDRFHFNWRLAFPLVILFIFTAISLWSNLYSCILIAVEDSNGLVTHLRGTSLGWIWSLYNLMILGASLIILLDVPQLELDPWFKLSRVVKITLKSDPGLEFWGITHFLSESQAYLALTQLGIPQLNQGEKIPVELCLVQENITLEGNIVITEFNGDFPIIKVAFHSLTLPQQRQLVELLFCRPGQWKREETPGELTSLWLLIRIIFRPRIIFARYPKIQGLRVSQV